MSVPATLPAYLTQAAATRYARIPVTKLRKLVAIGKLRTLAEPGESLRYRTSDLDAWVASQRADAPSQSDAEPTH